MNRQDDYRQTLLSQLEDLDVRFGGLADKIERLDGAARVEARKQLQAFRAQRGEALARLQSWDEVRHGADKVWYDLARSFDVPSTKIG